MHQQVADILLRECFGFRDRESFVVVAEPETAPVAERLAGAARDRGFPAALLVIPARAAASEEPPDFVVEALRAADIALLLTPHSLAGTQALRAVRAGGLRAAQLTDLTAEGLAQLAEAPLEAISSSAAAISGAAEPGRRICIRTESGTRLEFVAAADREIRDGIIRSRGEFGSLPPGFVRIAVEPGTVKGEVRADVWPPAGDAGRVVLMFDGGKLGFVSHPELREALHAGASVDSFGIGLNPAARPGRSGAESAISAGCAFLRMSSGNHQGRGPSSDFVFAAPHVEVDGVPIPPGILVPPRASRPPAAAPANPPAASPFEAGPEIIRLFFDNSNDPQYVIDFDNQTIVLANDAWLRLLGYSRSDVAAGRIKVESIVAEESRPKVAEKRETRKTVPSERYELKVKCADGTKKPVEASVQRVRVQGRDVVIGSLRDLTMQERMKKDLTERATEAMRKTLEIYALTEKIKNVPKLTPALLSGEDENDILAKAGKILTQKPGLSYASATISLIESHTLVQRWPVPGPGSGPSRFDMSKGHRLARIARGEEEVVDWSQNHIAIPLPGREGIIGVLEVTLDPKEFEVMTGQGGHTVRTEYQNLLVSLAQILALSIENLRLYRVVKEQSEIDQLTGVYNRRMFDRRLGDEVKRARRYGRDLALLMIDLDYFKAVNDTFGHPKGDETLRYVAEFFRVQSRNVDVVSRYGGDEFCLLLPECNLDNAVQKAEVVRKRFVTRKFSTVGRGDEKVRLTLSIGVAALSDQMASEFDLLKAADSALYRAKGAGRNRVCLAAAAGD